MKQISTLVAFLACIVPIGTVSAQHLGDLFCRADAVFSGTVLAIEDTPGGSELTVRIDQVLKGPDREGTVKLALSVPARQSHLQARATRVFLTAGGQLLRVEPSEHLAFIRKQIADESVCDRKW